MTRRLAASVCTALLLPISGTAGATPAPSAQLTSPGPNADCPWVGSTDPVDARITAVMAEMTLNDKIQLMHGTAAPFQGWGPEFAGVAEGIDRLCIPDHKLVDGPAGVGNKTRYVTQMPAPIALGATWDRELAREFGEVIGRQAREKGATEILSAGVDVTRDPRAGRTFENFGEDPVLVGEMGASEIRGINSQQILSVAKHLAAYTQETNRNLEASTADVDERTLHEIYLRPFEAAVDADVSSVMCSYNKVNGVKACNNTYLMTQVLKGQMGFENYTISDWYGAHSTIATANAGLDMIMPDSCNFGTRLKQVAGNEVSHDRIDDAVSRILRPLFERGVIDNPPTDNKEADVRRDADTALARQVAAEGMTLLRNRESALPLRESDRTIAVIGTGAGPAAIASGGGSAHVTAEEIVTPLQGLAARARAQGAQIRYSSGTNLAEVKKLAATSDAVIVVMHRQSSESADRGDLRFGLHQENIIKTAAAHSDRSVLVTNTGMPVDMSGYADAPDAILAAWYPGEQYGNALADVLFGDVNPGGKTPVTWPAAENTMPTSSREQFPGGKFTEGLEVGYRGYAKRGIEPLFAFGHGESYTTFEVDDVTVSEPAADGSVEVEATVKNTGDRAGSTVVQAYAQDVTHDDASPRGLADFAKVRLEAGVSQRISLVVSARDMSWWNAESAAFEQRAGEYEISVGQSVVDRAGSRVVRVAQARATSAPVPAAPAWSTVGNGTAANNNADGFVCPQNRIVEFFLGLTATLGFGMDAPQAHRRPTDAF